MRFSAGVVGNRGKGSEYLRRPDKDSMLSLSAFNEGDCAMADIKVTVDEHNDLTVFKVNGQIGLNDIIQRVQAFYSGESTGRVLWNFQSSPRLGLDLSNLDSIIKTIEKFSVDARGAKCALVRHPDFNPGLGSVFKALALEAGLKSEYAVFSEKDAAMQWLLQKAMTINALVVDDESVSRRVMQRIMDAHGHCEAVENGEQALAVFRAAMETGKCFDLVTLDVSMPDIDGIRVLKAIRKMEEENGRGGQKPVKVLMATANADSRIVKTCIEAGCDDYIVKPCSKDSVNGKLQKLGFI